MNNKINVLAVDDEKFNLDIMEEYFEDAPIEAHMTYNGAEALKMLDDGLKVDVIVLDRMMPVMNGMEFLKKVKADSKYRNIPVIMQTAASANHQVAEGIKEGVFYYLNKPYSKDVLLTLINAANEDHSRKEELLKELKQYGKAMSTIEKGEFKFQTLEEAKLLAILISSCLPAPEVSMIALTELMVNSIEHGNLGITYEEKSELKKTNSWELEVENRLKSPENINKFCKLRIIKDSESIVLNIKDLGSGFAWQQYASFDARRLSDPNGRGIMFSMNAGMEINFLGTGNEVECRINLKG